MHQRRRRILRGVRCVQIPIGGGGIEGSDFVCGAGRLELDRPLGLGVVVGLVREEDEDVEAELALNDDDAEDYELEDDAVAAEDDESVVVLEDDGLEDSAELYQRPSTLDSVEESIQQWVS